MNTPALDVEALVISDLHLGGAICQDDLLESFLGDISHGRFKTEYLILNGDVFDSWDFRRLRKKHWRILSKLRKLSKKIKVIWIEGNHDGPAELISHLIGVEVVKEYGLISGGRRILFIHGHQYDRFLDDHPILTWIGDVIYMGLQKLDPSFGLARRAKQASKTFLRNAEIVKTKAMAYASKNDYHAVCCGHTHHALSLSGVLGRYFNSGCWTEPPGTFLSIDNRLVVLHEYQEE